MTKRLADHLDRDTTVLGSSSPRMTKRVGSDGEVETQPLCQRLQTVVESSESGLVFTVGSLILPLLITVKNAEKVVGTAGTGRLPGSGVGRASPVHCPEPQRSWESSS